MSFALPQLVPTSYAAIVNTRMESLAAQFFTGVFHTKIQTRTNLITNKEIQSWTHACHVSLSSH